MDVMGHWERALAAAIALANAVGPTHSGGRRQALLEGQDALDVIAEALALATTRPPVLNSDDVEQLTITARQLWGALHEAGAGGVDAAAAQVNELLEVSQARPVLTRHAPDQPWHLHFTTTDTSSGRRWSSDLIVAVAVLLGSQELSRLRTCAAVECDRVLLDATRSHTQRYCSPNCQNRSKVAAFRARATGPQARQSSTHET
ncbi:MAG: CGNR zinc finger domain-containing protein [Actinobacteria bacterium]|nr:CGNR zinc finger domain-containing protein [Actinomycetota bacterium]